MRSSAALLLAAASPACTAGQDRDGAGDTAALGRESARSGCDIRTVTGHGVGALRIGASVDSVRARCAVARDTTRLGAEAQPARVLSVVVDGDTVGAEVVDGRVWRLSIERPGFLTADSLGVGTPLARLLRLPDARGISGEGALFVVAPSHCGLSFQLAASGAPPLGGEWTAEALRRLPPSTSVTRVLVVGCDPGR